jgi:hypothetical protein
MEVIMAGREEIDRAKQNQEDAQAAQQQAEITREVSRTLQQQAREARGEGR